MEVKRRILVPIEETRREPELKSVQRSNELEAVENYAPTQPPSRLDLLLEQEKQMFEKNEVNSTTTSSIASEPIMKSMEQTNQAEEVTFTRSTDESSIVSQGSSNLRGKGTMFYRSPEKPPSMSGNSTYICWKNPSTFEMHKAVGSPLEIVTHQGWHIHGAKIWMGTTSTQIDEPIGLNPATGVTGFIPKAVKEIKTLVSLNKSITQNSLVDEDGRPYQFAIVGILGGQDHKKLVRMLENHELNKQFLAAFKALGVPNVSLRAALYNEMGELFAIEVRLGPPELWGRGKHLIFIHPGNDVGGGKSDESLSDGRLSVQTSNLDKEFRYWVDGLSLGRGAISSIESTLGGTARIGRYAFERAKIPKTLIAKDAVEFLNVDTATWVKYNLSSQQDEYRANFNNTLLRSVWGEYAKRLRGFPIELSDRNDGTSSRDFHRQKSTIAILRHLHLGSEKVELLNWDISDGRWANSLQEAITQSSYLDIYDPTDSNKVGGPWEALRRIRLTSSVKMTLGKIESLAQANNPDEALDDAREALNKIHSLVSSDEDVFANRPGPFLTIDMLVPEQLLESGKLDKEIARRAGERLADGFRGQSVDKVIVNIYKRPSQFGGDPSMISVLYSEEQAAINVLIASTDEIDTHKKRVIMQNPNISSIDNPDAVKVYAFGRLIGRTVTAHKQSGYEPCIKDGMLIHAFQKYYYGQYGHQPNLLIGGKGRTRSKGGVE